ncbi:MAG: MFS transporter [Gammaproteobacteria bacterium]|nr:MFS transporter [Gammaproteobacteria bacterium]
MLRLFRLRGFLPLVAIAFLNAFVDLGHKVVVQNTVFKVFDGGVQIALTGLVNALILLPFVFLMTPAGFLSDRYAKPRVMRRAALAAVGVTVAITVCYYRGWFVAAFVCTLLLAVQSALYGPAKLGYVKELTGVEDLAAANGVMQAASTGAILIAMLAFSFGFEHLLAGASPADPATILDTIAPLGWYLVAAASGEYLLTLRLPDTRPDDPALSFDVAAYRRGDYLRETLGALWRRPVLRLSVIGLSIIWSIAQVLIAVYPTFAENFLALDNVATIQLIMAAASVGMVAGSVLAATLSRAHIETGFIPIGALGVAAALALMSALDSPSAQAALFFALGLFGALFIVPLNALIQFNAEADELGRVLAASSLVNNLVMIAFLALTVLFAWRGYSGIGLMAMLTAIAIGGALYTVYRLPQSLVRLLIARVFALRYRLHVSGMHAIPRSGGVLLLGNHVSWIDWAVVAMASPRPIRFVMARDIYERWYLRWFLDFVGVIPIAPGGAEQSLETIAALLRAGEVVCLFPEGTISRHGQLNEFKRGFERAAAKAADSGAIIVPFYLRGLWGSQFSHSSPGLRARSLRGHRRDIVVAFGAPMALAASAIEVKQAVSELSITAWEDYVATLGTLPRAWLETTRRGGGRVALIESGGRKLSRTAFACAVLAFARRLRRQGHGNAIGIMLPPSAAGALVNLAGLLAGRTVVNLNFTASAEAIRAAIARAGITDVYTSAQFLRKLEQRGSAAGEALAACRVHEMETERAALGRVALLVSWCMLKLLPAALIARLHGASPDPRAPAVILFSSGSEGQPKGVVLDHRNVLANIKQTTDMLNPVEGDVIVGSLPLFHAFGLTVTTLLPLLEGLPVLVHPDPGDVVNIAKAIYRHRATMLCGTSTFLRFYLRNQRVLPPMLESLRLVVAGAERLDPAVREGFAQKFGKPIYEGYGATETTPVASVNIPDYLDPSNWRLQVGSRPGSVGLPLPGSSFRVVDPDTLAKLPAGEDGLVLIGGVQVMVGYLDDAERTANAVVELDGRRWYKTGDKGHLDEDGFLTIVDRYSRFAKLGGEMVSLGAVERVLGEVFGADSDVVVVNLPDARKGERLVALLPAATPAFDESEIRARCLAAGLSALMVPEQWLRVESMPRLGSGKTDYARARELAAGAA